MIPNVGPMVPNGGPGGGSSTPASYNPINPVLSNNASGSIATTTGTIISGHNSLVVASATGWSVGMGIAVANAGPGGNTELISYVTGIAGTTFTLNDNASANATTQTVNHDDTRAISAVVTVALSAGTTSVYLPGGSYNVTSGLPTVTGGFSFFGDGSSLTLIVNRSKTANVFSFNAPAPAAGMLLRDFQIVQGSGVTPTAGCGILMDGGSISCDGLVVTRVILRNLWCGIYSGTGVNANWFNAIQIYSCVGGWGIDYNTPPSSGDNWFSDIYMAACSLRITASDTTTFNNLKIVVPTNGTGIFFNGSAATIGRIRFLNPSLEGAGSGTGIDFGSGASQVSVIGGEIAGWATSIANAANVAGEFSAIGVIYLNNTDTTTDIISRFSAGGTWSNLGIFLDKNLYMGGTTPPSSIGSGQLIFPGLSALGGVNISGFHVAEFQCNQYSNASGQSLQADITLPSWSFNLQTGVNDLFVVNRTPAGLNPGSQYVNYLLVESAGDVILSPGWTVAGLPGSPTIGARGYVTDSNLTMAGNYGATIAGHGGGSPSAVPVFYDGTNWRIG